MAIVYQNNFDGETPGGMPAGGLWVSTHGTWAVSATNPVAGSTQCLRATTDAALDCVLYTGASVTTGRFSYQFIANVASGVHGNVLAPLFRANNTATQGYSFFFDETGTCGLYYKNNAAGFTSLGSKVFRKVVCAIGDTMQVEVAMDGYRFEFRLWNVTAGQTRPVTPTVTLDDTTGAHYASGYCGVVLNSVGADANDGGLDNFVIYNDFTPSLAQPTQLIARSNAAIFYSPNNWYDNGTYKVAALPGAYMKFKFTGKTLGLSTGAITGANGAGSLPAVYYKAVIDGVSYTVSSIGETEFTFTDTLAAGTHTAEIHVEASLGLRWAGAIPAVCSPVIGIRVENTATVSAATLLPNRLLSLGDSLTEGTYVDGSALSIPQQNSARGTYARTIALALNAEYGVVAHAGATYNLGTTDGSPGLTSSWQYHWSGVSRLDGSGLFVDMPDYITVMMGTNGTTNQADVATVISGLRAAAPAAKIAFLIPLGNGGNAATTAAVAAAGDPNVVVIDVLAQVRQEAGLSAAADGSSGSYDGIHYNRKLHAAIGAIWGGKMTAAFMPRRFTLNVV